MRQRRSVLLMALVTTMVSSSFQIFAIAVLAVELIDDMGVSRSALGLLGALNTMVGATTAPYMGRLTDRIGARASILIIFTMSATGLGIMAVAPNLWILALSTVISGIPQGWGNPATNALIAERVGTGARGTVTGIKQSGVQVGIFLSGLTLPTLAGLSSWRGSVWIYAGVFMVVGLVIAAILPKVDPLLVTSDGEKVGSADADAADSGSSRRAPLDPFIWRLALYALSFGTVGGAVGRFFPLWANEVVGLSVFWAGMLVALGGLLGIGARIAAGRIAEHRVGPVPLLSGLALIGALYCVVLLAATTVGSWVLWPATILNAVGIGAWNAVAMLAVIMTVPRADAGRASGIVMLGFLGGLSIGSPIAGLMVDALDSYQPVWALAIALSLFSSVVLRVGRPAKEAAA